MITDIIIYRKKYCPFLIHDINDLFDFCQQQKLINNKKLTIYNVKHQGSLNQQEYSHLYSVNEWDHFLNNIHE